MTNILANLLATGKKLGMKNRLLIAALLLLSLTGIVVSYHLTQHHYQFLSGTRPGTAFCNISAKINCDAVTASRFAEFRGVSTSSYSLGLYAFLAILSVITLLSSGDRGKLRHYADIWLFCAIATAAVSVGMLGITLFVVKTICLNCSLLYLVSFLALAAAIMLRDGSVSAQRSIAGLLVLGVLCGVCLAASVGWDRGQRRLALQRILDSRDHYLNEFRSQPQLALNTEGAPSKGANDAKLTIVEFSDFACPFCRRAAFMSQAVLQNYADKVRLVFKHYPLDSECNRNLEQPVHPFACEAARGSVCAQAQNRFWEYHDALFGNEGEHFSPKTAADAARTAKLDIGAFEQCMRTAEPYRKLSQDIDEATRLGIDGTPAFFFNGRRFSGMLPPPIIEMLIEESLKNAK